MDLGFHLFGGHDRDWAQTLELGGTVLYLCIIYKKVGSILEILAEVGGAMAPYGRSTAPSMERT